MFEHPKRMTMMDDRLLRLGDLQHANPGSSNADNEWPQVERRHTVAPTPDALRESPYPGERRRRP